MSVDKIRRLEGILTAITVAAFPLIFLPIFPNPFVTPKLVFFGILLSVLFILKAFKNIISKRKGLVFATSAYDLPVFLLAAAYLASGWLVTPNRMEAFWLPGVASFVIGGALLYFLVNQLTEGGKQLVKIGLLVSAGILSLLALISVSGILKNSGLPPVVRLDTFSPSGSILTLVIFLVVLVPFAADVLRLAKNTTVKTFAGALLGITAMASVAGIYTLVRNWSETQLPSFATSWVVATEALKERAFLGAGPSNYLTAFSRFVPLSFNQSDAWNLRFANGHSYLLTALTEVGLFGLAALVVLAITVYKKSRQQFADGKAVHVLPLIMLVVFLALFPATPTLLMLLFVLLALTARTHVVHMFVKDTDETASLEGKIASYFVSIPTIIISLFSAFLLINAARGEFVYNQAIKAIAANNGREAYDTLRSAINISPFADRYHITYAQLNLALANSMAQKQDLTDQERSTVGQLVQQAIREARSAVVLNRQRAGNWEALAAIYRSVIPIAKGADQFAVQTYSQAIALDPINPGPRIALGGIFYQAKRYEEAIDIFRLAVVAKPNSANARYNLAIAYRDNGQYERALAELTQAISLVQSGTQDHDILKKEIENVQSKAPQRETQAKSGESVRAPEVATETGRLNPPVELPDDATPPTSDSASDSTTSPSPTPAQ